MKFDEEKYTSLIMYILAKCYGKPNIGKTVLCTVMYFIDFDYYELYGTYLTNETYIKSKRGIKPKHFRKITQDLIDRNKPFMRKEPYYNRILHRYYLTILPNLKFTAQELLVIDSCIEKLCDSNATTITKYACGDKPLLKAGLGEEINYNDVFLRDEIYSINK